MIDARDEENWPEPEEEQPEFAELEAMVFGSEDATATDGCTVDPDGCCEHGHPSWLLRLGMI